MRDVVRSFAVLKLMKGLIVRKLCSMDSITLLA